MSENEKKSTEEKVTSSDFENVLHGNSEKAKGLKYIDVCEKMKKSREQFNSILNPSPIDLRMQEKHSSFYQIKNPEALKAITDAQKKFENTRRILASMLPDTPPLADRFKIQEYIAKVLSAPKVNNAAITAYQKMGEALKNAALSGSITDYKTNLQNAIEAEEEFSDSSSIEEKENPLCYNLNILQGKSNNIKDEDEKSFQELKEETGCTASDVALNNFDKIQQDVSDINKTLSAFLVQFEESAMNLLSASQLTQQNIEKLVNEAQKNNAKITDLIETAEKNGNTVKELRTASQNNFEASKVDAKKNTKLSYVAIGIALVGVIAQIGFAIFDYCTDNNEKIIEILQSKYFYSPKNHIEKSSNMKVALEKDTMVSQDNVKLMQKTNRLQADLKKAQGDLAELKKQYNTDKGPWTQEKQKLYAEIAALKKQIEDLKAELIKRPVPQSVSRQEAENE